MGIGQMIFKEKGNFERMSPVVTSAFQKPYRRVLLKISGEALMGEQTHGIQSEMLARISHEVAVVKSLGIEVCLVVGGGNIYRGINGHEQGINRTTADYMGMLATILNALALQSCLEGLNIQTRVMSAIPMQTVCEPYIRRRAIHHMEKGRLVIFAAGTGNPYFTTDTAATLRAKEMECDALFKGTKVDGVYSADPFKDPQAVFYPRLTYTEVLSRDLKVMDGAAISLAKDGGLPVIVFSIKDKEGFPNAIEKKGKFTLITSENKDAKG